MVRVSTVIPWADKVLKVTSMQFLTLNDAMWDFSLPVMEDIDGGIYKKPPGCAGA